jgi:hypothetical protein
MKVLVEMSEERVGALGAVTGMLVDVDRTINQLLAVKEGLLAVGARLSFEIGADAAAAAEPGLPDSYAGDAMDLAARAVAAEFAVALQSSDRSLQRRMADADAKVALFPAVWRAQGAGVVTAGQARAIVDAGTHLDDESDRGGYAEEMIDLVQAPGMSPSRVGRAARRAAERRRPRSLQDRHRGARRARRIWVKDRADGMAEFGLLGPAALIHGASDRLTAMGLGILTNAPARREAGDDRCLDEIRADLALDLLLTGRPAGHDPDGLLAGVTGAVSVTIPVTALLGVARPCAELDGSTPIDGATARRLAADAPGWDRVLTHPITGAVLAVDRYRPSAELRRWLRARDQRCRFPGCGYLARDCDVDHTTDAAAGGPTAAHNLGVLCRRHHVLKHQTPWTVEQLDGGTFSWTSPTRKIYLDTLPPPNTSTPVKHDQPPPF